ncbi:universal stress protein [Natrarchaeobius halalkaliphilus]|uniref:Universal stress protein n=1 Tax=Natrarchaeobius halalkaliphilus TaxID=1679091 RepID=A0A3N6MR04_9EURY|nr:universal stress protein [Natrarchaeobius halalkaliphilus]RQG86663.1 universal stress protein [Natrarchaeobius halalkaliphilus]
MHVLVPLDGSQQSWAAFDHALSTAEGAITALHVVNPADGVYSDYDGGGYYDPETHQRTRERGDELLAQARTRAEEARASEAIVLESAIETGPPARTIVEYARDNDVGRIVMGSHGRSGVARILLGSVAEAVARRAPVPVTIVR